MESHQVQPDQVADPGKPVESTVEVLDAGNGKEVLRASVTPQPPRDPNRPAWLPEKFQDAAALKTATVELAKKLGRGGAEVKVYDKMAAGEDLAEIYADLEKAQSKPADPKEPAKPEPVADVTKEVSGVLEKAGLKLDEFQTEFDEKGELGEASFKKLSDAGFSKSLVEQWIKGQKAVAEQLETEVYSASGGTKDSFQAMAEWAKVNLPKGEIDAFNRIVASRDHAAIKGAAAGLYARYEAAGGVEPKLLGGDTSGGGPAVQPFQSWVEVQAAMRDPRYKAGDRAYHADIDRRLAISNI